MSSPSIDVQAKIENTPEAVMGYIANVRNRPLYLPSLKSVADIKETPGGAGTTWKWTWVSLGMSFEGIGRCLKYEPGRLYSFKTEGGIESTWTYKTEPEGDGQATKLTIHVDYAVPERARPILPSDKIGDAMKKTEADQVIQNLKTILDR
jgi:carbon monoxide dehydrogenase subunit G